jgi:CheY-like chemotaxis protein
MPIRCLIVDDNQAFLDAARVLLERAGLTIAGTASTSAEAVEKAETLRPDVVLVDLMLGRESGFELARRMVEGGRDRSTVILISTRAEDDVADLIAGCPTVEFVPKAELSGSAIRRIVGSSGRRER